VATQLAGPTGTSDVNEIAVSAGSGLDVQNEMRNDSTDRPPRTIGQAGELVWMPVRRLVDHGELRFFPFEKIPSSNLPLYYSLACARVSLHHNNLFP